MLNKQVIKDIIQEILDETDYTEEGVRPRTISRFLKEEHMNPEKVIALYMVSDSYTNAFIGSGATSEHNIPIGVLKDFTDQFLMGDDFDSESLNEAVKSLVEYAGCDNDNHSRGRKIHCRSGDHITCLVRNATKIGKEHAIYSYDELIECFVRYEASWYMCEVLELPHVV